MKKICHATDVHTNFLISNRKLSMEPEDFTDAHPFEEFANKIKDTKCEAVVITGDITEAPYLEADLKYLKSFLKMPIYFVLGNHDYYGGSIQDVKNRMQTFSTKSLCWLENEGSVIRLTDSSCLVGVDGWYDVRAGLGPESRLVMSDAYEISDFRFQPHIVFVSESRNLAEKATALLEKKLMQAIDLGYRKVYIAMHVPPFHEASLAPDRTQSNGHWAPYMTSIAMGDMLTEIAESNRDVEFTVLCGHTHSFCEYSHLSNLKVRVGQADYGSLMFNVVEVE